MRPDFILHARVHATTNDKQRRRTFGSAPREMLMIGVAWIRLVRAKYLIGKDRRKVISLICHRPSHGRNGPALAEPWSET